MNLNQYFTSTSFKAYQKWLKTQKLPPSTIKRKLSSLRRFDNWLKKGPVPRSDPNRGSVLKGSWISKRTDPIGKKLLSYLYLSLLVLFSVALGIYGYQQIFKEVVQQYAYPQAPSPTTPNRYLSFQARLTDSSDNPITVPTDFRFIVYDADAPASASAKLWEEQRYIDPDQDGIFSVTLGTETAIPTTLFTENANLWLGVTVETDPEATPRQRIATVAYALNAETLQGFPPSASASANMIPVLTQEGDLVLAEPNPMVYSSSGTFSIKGQVLTLTTATGTGGDIQIAPDGTGNLDINLSSTAQNAIYITNASQTSGDLIHAYLGNDTASGNLLTLSSGAVETNKFTVSRTGQAYISGNTGIGTTAPGQKLDVVGAVQFSGALMPGSTAGTSGQFLISAGAGVTPTWTSTVPATSVPFSGITSGTNTQAAMVVGTGASLNYTGTGTINASSLVGATWIAPGAIGSTTPSTGAFTTLSSTSGTNLATSTGNVGIGTTGPGELLHVAGTSAPTIKVSNTDAAGTASLGVYTGAIGALFRAYGSTFSVSSLASKAGFGPHGASGLVIFTNAISPSGDTGSLSIRGGGYDTAAEKLYIDKDGSYFTGNVGIGTTGPTHKFEVRAGASGTIFLGNTNGGYNYGLVFSGTGISTSGTDNLRLSTYNTNDIVLQQGVGRDVLYYGGGYTPLVAMKTSGNVGIGTTNPLQKLHVEGQCVTGDSLLPIKTEGSDPSDITYTRIDQIKGGEQVLSLNETTGKLEPQPIKGLLDMGVQPVYKLTTEDGKTIRTTGNHPYLVKSYSLISTPDSESKNTLPENSVEETSFNNFPMADSNLESTGGWTLNTTIPDNLADLTSSKLAKSLSLVSKTQDSLVAKDKTAPFFNPLGETKTEKPAFFKKEAKRTSTFSSSKNLSLAGFSVKGDIADSFDLLGGKMESGFDSTGGQGGKSSINVSGSLTSFQKLQDLPNHNSGTVENGFTMTNFGVSDDGRKIFASHSSHSNSNYINTPANVNPVRENSSNGVNVWPAGRSLGAGWTKVIYLKVGDEIAVQDGETIAWQKIQSIEYAGYEQVWDIEVENTHNFVANGIIAHNTYISGNVGIGTTNPSSFALEVAGNLGPEATNTRNLGSASRYFNTIYVNNIVGTGALGYWNRSGTVLSPATAGDIVNVGDGTAALPAYSFTNDTDSGLYRIASDKIALATGATARIAIDATGNVGIGTTEPGGTLDLGQSVTAASAGTYYTAKLNNSYTGTMASATPVTSIYGLYNRPNIGIGGTSPQLTNLFVNYASGNIGIGTTSVVTNLYLNYAAAPTLNTGSSVTNTYAFVSEAGAGNVGIGTTGPSVKLHVVGDGTYSAAFMSGKVGIGTVTPGANLDIYNGGSSSSLRLMRNYTSNGYGAAIWSAYTDVVGVYDSLALGAGTAADPVANETMRITSGNRVGIGTITPMNKLDVNGGVAIGTYAGVNTAGTGNLIISGNVGIGTTGPSQKLQVGDGSTLVNVLVKSSGSSDIFIKDTGYTADLLWGMGVDDGYAGLRFRTERIDTDSFSSPRTVMYLDDSGDVGLGGDVTAGTFAGASMVIKSGNVGIGTTAPGAKLNVQGGSALIGSNGSGQGFILQNDVYTSNYGSLTRAGTSDAAGVLNLYYSNSLKIQLDPSANSYINPDSGGLAVGAINPGSAKLYVNGNVGIGTTAPGAKLEVAGQVKITGGTPGLNKVLSSDASGLASWSTITGTGGVGGSGTLNYVAKWTPDGSNLGNSLIFDNGTNVGIGSTSPSAKLTINGTTEQLRLEYNPTNYQSFTVNSAGSLFVAQNGSAATLALTDSGRVGIGTTGPGALLEVRKDQNSVTQLRVNNATSGTAAYSEIQLNNNAGDLGYLTAYSSAFDSGYPHFAGRFSVAASGGNAAGLDLRADKSTADIRFYSGGYAASNERVRITSTGNVGIGTTGPSKKLDVAGDILINGGYALYVGDTLTKIGESSGLYFDSGHSTRPLRFLINGAEKMTVATTGNVGIGTTGPYAKLAVESGDIFINGSTHGSAVGIDYNSFNNGIGLANSLNGNFAALVTGKTSGTWGGVLQFITRADGGGAGQERMTINSTGNVGIGTTGPTQALDVNGNITVKPGGYVYTDLIRGIGGAVDIAASSYTYISGGSFIVQSATNLRSTVTLDQNLIVNGTGNTTIAGNVGIGTTGPQAKLHVGAGTDAPALSSTLYVSENGNTAITMRNSSTDIEMAFGAWGVGFFGTRTNHDLYLQTNGSNFMSLSKSGGLALGSTYVGTNVNDGNAIISGNVGIGTTGPGTKLEVAGQVKITGGTPGTNKVLTSDSVGLASWSDITSVGIGGSGTTNYLPKFTASTTLGNSVLYETSGNVGIGTTGPGAKLEIGTTNVAADEEGTFRLGVAGTAAGEYYTIGRKSATGNLIFRGYQDGVSAFRFFTKATTDQERLTILNNGNVGIGDAAPGAKLSVVGNATIGYVSAQTAPANGLIIQGNVGIGTPNPQGIFDVQNKFRVNTGAVAQGELLGTATSIDSYSGGQNLQFLASPAVPGTATVQFAYYSGGGGNWKSAIEYSNVASGYGNLLLMKGGGNVGIGTTGPGTKLEVAGQVKITGGTPGTNKVLTSDSVGLASWSDITSVGIGGSGTTNYLPKFTASTTLGNSVLYETSGNVGIGTTGPADKLEVSGGNINASTAGSWLKVGASDTGIDFGNSNYIKRASADGSMTLTANGILAMTIKSGNVGIGDAAPGAKLSVVGNATIGYVSAQTAPANGLIIQGNVGIGTTNPGAPLDVNGRIFVGAGTDALPGLAFRDDTNSGITWESADRWHLNAGGARKITLDASLVSILGTAFYSSAIDGSAINYIRLGAGSVSSPTFSFYSDPNTGIYNTAADKLGLVAGGTESMTITAGNVGIGTTNPGAKLEVAGSSTPTGGLQISTSGSGTNLYFNAPGLDLRPTTAGRGELRLIPNGTADVARGELTILNTDATTSGGNNEWLAIFGKNDVINGDSFYFQSNKSGTGVQRPIWFDSMGGVTNFKLATDGTAWFYNKVGIGVNAGSYALNITGDTKSSASVTSPRFYGTDFGSYVAYAADTNIQSSTGYGINFKSGTTTNVVITTAGNVGIGTVSPLSKLGVLGNLSVGGTYGAIAAPTGGAIIEGNVGIGTTGPGTKLEVAGQVKITGGTPGTNKVLTSDSVGLASWSDITSVGIGGSGTTNYLPKFTASTTLGNSVLYETSGNVGIGTTNPLQKLHVAGNCVTFDTILPIRRKKRSKKQDKNMDGDGDDPNNQKIPQSGTLVSSTSLLKDGPDKLGTSITQSELDDYDYFLLPISDVLAGDEVLSLDESTADLKYSRINRLIDMGLKEVYEITLKSGRSIKTTAEHPFLTLQNYL